MNGDRFAGKVAIVTGAGSGIGLAIARRLIGEGALVVGADIARANLDAIQIELGARFQGTVTDVVREADVEAMVATAVDTFGAIDIAFNVAGGSRRGTIVELSEADWDFTVDLCLKGTFLSVKHQARRMIAQGSGAIVNVASLNAHIPSHGGVAYSSAKAGVEMLTKTAALELTSSGVRVNALLPGLVETPLTRKLLADENVKAAFLERIPSRRPSGAEEQAQAALFLASDEARYISGASLTVDGGWAVTGYPDLTRFR